MTKISTFLNYIITLFAIIILSFSWLSTVIDSTFITIIICLLICIAFNILFFIAVNHQQKKKNTKKIAKKKADNISLKLKIINSQNLIEYFKQLLSIQSFQSTSENHIQTDTANYFFCFENDSLSKTEFCKLLKNANFNKEISILCQSVQEDAKLLSQRFKAKINFIELPDIITLMEKNNSNLELTEILEKPKPMPLLILRNMAKRQKTYGYVIIALSLLAFSFISPYRLYYQIFASVLILFATIIYFLKL